MIDSAFVRTDGELHLSNLGIRELMEAVLSRKASFRFQATGFSMWPFIKDGDTVTIAPVNGRFPAVGDIAAFFQPDSGRLAIHRIIQCKRTSAYLFCGDNCQVPDGIIPKKNLIGIVTNVERGGRKLWFGISRGSRAIAWLSSHGWLMPTRIAVHFPLRIASAILRRLRRR